MNTIVQVSLWKTKSLLLKMAIVEATKDGDSPVRKLSTFANEKPEPQSSPSDVHQP